MMTETGVCTEKRNDSDKTKRKMGREPLGDKLRGKLGRLLTAGSIMLPAGCKLESAEPGTYPHLTQSSEVKFDTDNADVAQPDTNDVLYVDETSLDAPKQDARDTGKEADVGPEDDIDSDDCVDSIDSGFDMGIDSGSDSDSYDSGYSDLDTDSDVDTDTEGYDSGLDGDVFDGEDTEPDTAVVDEVEPEYDASADYYDGNEPDMSFPDVQVEDEIAADETVADEVAAEVADISDSAELEVVADAQETDDGAVIIIPDSGDIADSEIVTCEETAEEALTGWVNQDTPLTVGGYRFYYGGLADGIDGIVLNIHCAATDALMKEAAVFEDLAGGSFVELNQDRITVEIHQSNDFAAHITVTVSNL